MGMVGAPSAAAVKSEKAREDALDAVERGLDTGESAAESGT
jgi:hypothetical protein